jgi:hypothetical protein
VRLRERRAESSPPGRIPRVTGDSLSRLRGHSWPLASVLLFLVLTLPFVGRAHGTDDPLYLTAAQHVWVDPLHPLSGASFWHERPTRLFEDLYNPPLVAYLLAPVVAWAGPSEPPVHLLMIGIGGAGLVLAGSVGARLGVDRRWTLLLAASPLLCISAVSAATDLPFTVMVLLAWTSAWSERPVWSGVLVGLCTLTKYVGWLSLPPALLPLRRPASRVSCAAAALAMFGLWLAWDRVAHGAFHIAAVGRLHQFSARQISANLASFVTGLGLAGLPAALGLLRWTRTRLLTAVSAGSVGGWLILRDGGDLASVTIAVVAAAAGAALVQAALATLPREPFSALAFLLLALNASAFVYFGAARYALPLLPPLLWLLVRGGGIHANPSHGRFVLSLAAAVLLCLAFQWADAGYADAWKLAAARLPPAKRGLQTGHWGFQWYAAARGYLPLDPRAVPRAGDRVALPYGIHTFGPLPAHRAVLEQEGVETVASPSLRIMDAAAHAGFYSSAWGPLPLGFRRGAQERVGLWTVAPWLLSLAEQSARGVVAVDLGTAPARHLLLDGWSADESFVDGGTRRTFVWMMDREAALRVALPSGVTRLALRASPTMEAVGALEIAVGRARAAVSLRAGWQTYEVPVTGLVDGGLTTVVLRPSGFHRPGPFESEDRPLSVAVEGIVFGGPYAVANRGAWAVALEGGHSGFLVLGETPLPGCDGGTDLRLAADEARITWRSAEGGERPVWLGGDGCAEPVGCQLHLTTPDEPGQLVLTSPRAVLLGFACRPAVASLSGSE